MKRSNMFIFFFLKKEKIKMEVLIRHCKEFFSSFFYRLLEFSKCLGEEKLKKMNMLTFWGIL